MVRTMSAFLEFCYFARRDFHTEETLVEMQSHLDRFHMHRTIFIETGVRTNLNPPRQHSLRHYIQLIQDFGALPGLCSSITESAHIRAIKKPWRRSSRFHALGQMLLTNQRLDKLAAARADFQERGMLSVPLVQTVEESLNVADEDDHMDDASTVSDQSSHGDFEGTGGGGDSDSDSDVDLGLGNIKGAEGIISSIAILAKRPCELMRLYVILC